MGRTRHPRALLALAGLCVTSLLAASIAHAGGSAEAHGHAGLKKTNAHAIASGGIGPCNDDDSLVGVGPVSSVCFRTGGAGANVGYASSTSGAGRNVKVVSFIKGDASAGLGVSAVGDTAVHDSMQIAGVSAPGQITLQIRGRIYVESRAVAGGTASTRRLISVYPNSAAANNDVDRDGDGALFHGEIEVRSAPGSPPTAQFRGGLQASDFTQQLVGNELLISAVSLNKVIPVADTTAVVIRTEADAVSPVVPMAAPLAAGAIAALLGGTALVAMRRRARIEA